MYKELDALGGKEPGGCARGLGAVGGDPDVECLALVDGGDEGTYGLLEWCAVVGAMMVEDVDIVDAHAGKAVVERGEEVFARAAHAVRTWPHIPAGLGGEDELVAVGAKVFFIDGLAEDGAIGLINIDAAEVLPEAE